MTGPHPAVAAIRLAVRRELRVLSVSQKGRAGAWSPHVRRGGAVMVACSGGADSLALLAATIFELRRSDHRVVGAVVDHGLQEGSARHTQRVVEQMAAMGADETASVRVTVDPGPSGIEAGARQARYAALDHLASHLEADLVLLGHTVDDQAETVLLGFTQGSGGRSVTGMRTVFHLDEANPGPPVFERPLLRHITRAQTEAACRAEGIAWWEDPHNADPRFLRARVRHAVLPILERELGPGVTAALARTGHLLRDDLDALDDLAEQEWAGRDFSAGEDVASLEVLPAALLSRVLRRAALAAGCPPRELTFDHVSALEAMVWVARGEVRALDLPGHVRAVRRGDVLRLERAPRV